MAETWFTPKEWKARLVEFAGRRFLRNVANGETVTYDVSRSEGQVSQEGDAFNTKNMNDLEQRISNGFANAKKNIDALNRDLGGCSFEQNGNAFYVVGADSVRKKLGDQEFAALDCGGVAWTAGEFGQWHHGYHFTKVSEIPNFGSMIHGKDFFIEVYNGGTEQLNAGIGVSYVKHSDSELVMTSVNGLHSLNVRIYYAVDFTRPAPSSFLKSIDFTIASGTTTKNILLADIPDAGEIVCAGLVSRGWEGWNALNVTYTTESVTITFSTSGHNGTAFGSEIVRVWYR